MAEPGLKKIEVPLPAWLYKELKSWGSYNGLPMDVTARLLLGHALGGGNASGLNRPPARKSKAKGENALAPEGNPPEDGGGQSRRPITRLP